MGLLSEAGLNTIQVNVSPASKYVQGLACQEDVDHPLAAGIGVGYLLKRSHALNEPDPWFFFGGLTPVYWGTALEAGGLVESIFSVENTYIGGQWDDPYAEGQTVLARVMRPGDIIYAAVFMEGPDPILYGDPLVAYGDVQGQEGLLGKRTASDQHVVGVCIKKLTKGEYDTGYSFCKIRVA